jgi:hypothetical protein
MRPIAIHLQQCFANYIAAISCPVLVFRAVSSEDTGLGAMVNVSCPDGQRLSTGLESMITVCTHTGEWNPEVPDCIGGSLSWSALPIVTKFHHFNIIESWYFFRNQTY